MGSLFRAILPIAASFLAPGLGTAIGAGLGAGASWAPLVGGGVLGAATGGVSGGNLKSALLGGVTGLAGAGISQGLNGQGPLSGLSGIGDSVGSAITDLTGVGADGGAIGRAVSSITGGGAGSASDPISWNSARPDGVNNFGDIISENAAGTNALTNSAAPLSAGGASSYSSSAGNLIGGVNSYIANQDAEDELLKSQNQAMGAYSPYINSGNAANSRLNTLLGLDGGDSADSEFGSLTKQFQPGDLTQDPGYQFQREQGEQALGRANSARGNVFSGAALKAATEYGQGLADTTYNEAYARDRAQKADVYGRYAAGANAGQQAAAAAAGIYGNMGNIKANSGVQGSNIFNSTISSLLQGSGARQIVGYKDGKPIYADEGLYKEKEAA